MTGVVIAATALAACEGQVADGGLSEWRAATSAATAVSIDPESGEAFMVVAGWELSDVYSRAEAIIALGPALVAERGAIDTEFRSNVQAAFGGAGSEDLAAGTAATAEVVLEVDRRIEFLDEASSAALSASVQASAPHVEDFYDALAFISVARQLGLDDAVVARALQVVRSVGQHTACEGSDALFMAARALAVMDETPVCQDTLELAAVRAEALEVLAGQLESNSATVSLGESVAILAMAETSTSSDEDPEVEVRLRELFHRAVELVSAGRISEHTAVSANLARTAEILGEPWELPEAVSPWIAAVVSGGGEPMTFAIDAAGVAQAAIVTNDPDLLRGVPVPLVDDARLRGLPGMYYDYVVGEGAPRPDELIAAYNALPSPSLRDQRLFGELVVWTLDDWESCPGEGPREPRGVDFEQGAFAAEQSSELAVIGTVRKYVAGGCAYGTQAVGARDGELTSGRALPTADVSGDIGLVLAMYDEVLVQCIADADAVPSAGEIWDQVRTDIGPHGTGLLFPGSHYRDLASEYLVMRMTTSGEGVCRLAPE
ncbi:hypothetical protein [Demequina gelatinilytica]|uniref:hypothetical protein n=1 Tax=Demequina gelatinilytica TaxID=1638980 RepID=UPI0012DFFE8D|nr:hypothetical protein [Demequina gelatinilytica]